MTSLSLVPEIANYCGIDFPKLVEKFYKMQVLTNEKKIYVAFVLLILLSTYNLKITIVFPQNFILKKS